jgi:hypothetical protein
MLTRGASEGERPLACARRRVDLMLVIFRTPSLALRVSGSFSARPRWRFGLVSEREQSESGRFGSKPP